MIRTIGITMGEPNGIGPELTARVLAQPQSEGATFRIFGSPNLLSRWIDRLHIQPTAAFEIISCGPDPMGGEFSSEEERAEASIAALDTAAEEARTEKIGALLTAPVDKAVIRRKIKNFTGHTEYLARRAGGTKTVMMLDNTEIRVVLLTEHIPLREVSSAVTTELIKTVCRIAVKDLQQVFGFERPKLAVAGINPHAGEIVEAAEEESVLLPAILTLKKEGMDISGPFAADTIFTVSKSGAYDLIVSPFHDQGLVAVKYPGFAKVVNITLGLPYLRVSPGHGVAYDIVGQKPADPGSFERALRVAVAGRLVP